MNCIGQILTLVRMVVGCRTVWFLCHLGLIRLIRYRQFRLLSLSSETFVYEGIGLVCKISDMVMVLGESVFVFELLLEVFASQAVLFGIQLVFVRVILSLLVLIVPMDTLVGGLMI